MRKIYGFLSAVVSILHFIIAFTVEMWKHPESSSETIEQPLDQFDPMIENPLMRALDNPVNSI